MKERSNFIRMNWLTLVLSCVTLMLTIACGQHAEQNSSLHQVPASSNAAAAKKKALEWLKTNVDDFEEDKDTIANHKLACAAWVYPGGPAYPGGRYNAETFDSSNLQGGQILKGYQPALKLDEVQNGLNFQPLGRPVKLDECYKQILSAKNNMICVVPFNEGIGTIVDAPAINISQTFAPIQLDTRPLSFQHGQSKYQSLRSCLGSIGYHFENTTLSEPLIEDQEYNLRDFSTRNATEIFMAGFRKAKEYAKEKGVPSLYFKGSGDLARSLVVTVNPIEVQAVYMLDRDNGQIEIGRILPEKAHLSLLKSPSEIFREISKMIDKAVAK